MKKKSEAEQLFLLPGLKPVGKNAAKKRFQRAFLKQLKSGAPVASEDVMRGIATREGVDRRCIGPVVMSMVADGLIEKVAPRNSKNRKHRGGLKNVWQLRDATKKGGGNHART